MFGVVRKRRRGGTTRDDAVRHRLFRRSMGPQARTQLGDDTAALEDLRCAHRMAPGDSRVAEKVRDLEAKVAAQRSSAVADKGGDGAKARAARLVEDARKLLEGEVEGGGVGGGGGGEAAVEAAEEKLSDALVLHPTLVEARNLRTACLLRLKRFAAAHRDAEQVSVVGAPRRGQVVSRCGKALHPCVPVSVERFISSLCLLSLLFVAVLWWCLLCFAASRPVLA